MAVLTRDVILSADDLERELVDVPEWGDGAQVYVRALTGEERDKFESSIAPDARSRKRNMANIRARLAVSSIVDESGVRVFSDSDITALGKKNAHALNRVYEVVARLSGLGEDDIEELAGNSDEAPDDDSG